MVQRIDKLWIPLGIVLAANWLMNVLCFFQAPDLFLCWLKHCSQLPSGLSEGSLGSLIISSISGKVKPLHRSRLMSSSTILAFSKFILWLIPCKLYQWVRFNSSIDFTCHIYMDYPFVALISFGFRRWYPQAFRHAISNEYPHKSDIKKRRGMAFPTIYEFHSVVFTNKFHIIFICFGQN